MTSTRSWAIVAAAVLVVLVVLGWQMNLLGVRALAPAGSLASLFEPTPQYPGYTWTRDGHAVDGRELNTIGGPAHCDWQSATYLHIGWPPGTVAADSRQARLYIRDPHGVVPGTYRERLRLHATLPPDAAPTGYRLGDVELWLGPSDRDEAVYLVGRGDVERWPRSDPMTLCM